MVKHDIENECIMDVERGYWRFAITVFPFYQPTSAAVQLLAKPHSPGRPPPRCRRIPYVSPGFQTRDHCHNLLPRHRREGHRLKFSRSASTLVLGGKSLSSLTNGQLAQNRQANKQADEQNREAKQSALDFARQESTLRHETQGKKNKNGGPQTVAEWKAFYKKRAEEILANEPPMPPTTKMTRTSYGLTTS